MAYIGPESHNAQRYRYRQTDGRQDEMNAIADHTVQQYDWLTRKLSNRKDDRPRDAAYNIIWVPQNLGIPELYAHGYFSRNL